MPRVKAQPRPDFITGRNKPKKPARTGLCMDIATRNRIVQAAKKHNTATRILLNGLLTYFEEMHVDWQAAMLRGEKVPQPPI